MNTDPLYLLTKLEKVADFYWSGLCHIYPKLIGTPKPIIRLNGRIYKTAGRCWQQEGIIEIGSRFLNHNTKYRHEILNVTLPHEIIHLADYRIFGPCEFQHGHGKGWRYLMTQCGLDPNPYHEMHGLSR